MVRKNPELLSQIVNIGFCILKIYQQVNILMKNSFTLNICKGQRFLKLNTQLFFYKLSFYNTIRKN